MEWVTVRGDDGAESAWTKSWVSLVAVAYPSIVLRMKNRRTQTIAVTLLYE